MTVRMYHPETKGDYAAQASQVEFLKASGWEVADDDADYDRWPAELQRFEGQGVVKMRHPQVEGRPDRRRRKPGGVLRRTRAG